MIALDSGDKIRGDASAASVVDYTIHGLDDNAIKQLADGQLADTIGDLFTADSADVVTTIILVNTDTSARTVNLYLTPSGGTARRLIPKDVSLGIGYSLHFDGGRIVVIDASGNLVTSYGTHAPKHTDGTDDIQDATAAQKGVATAAQITKLDAIEASATADQTGAEIKALYEVEANAFTDAKNTKLAGIATGATLYPDAGEQAFLDADHTKLDNIAANATKYPDTGEQAFLDADHTKLDGIASGADATPDATTTTKGKAELAVASEINTGDDTVRTISPKELSDSNYGKRIMYVKVLANDTAVATGDGKAYVTIPIELNGMNLVLAHAAVYTASTSGLPSIQIHNLTDTADMLSTNITLDENELNSYTAATPPVINGATDDVVTGDVIRIDVDVAGTGTKGLDVILTFQLP